MGLDGQQITHQSYLKILERNYDPYTVKKEFKEFFFLAFELNISYIFTELFVLRDFKIVDIKWPRPNRNKNRNRRSRTDRTVMTYYYKYKRKTCQ